MVKWRQRNERDEKHMRKVLNFLVAIIMIFSLGALTACSEKPSKYSDEEHVNRITKRIEKRFINGSAELTGFQVFPLYDEADEIKYFLVEFEPYGFLYIRINEKYSTVGSWFGGVGSMYTLSDTEVKMDWSRYIIDETNSQPFPDKDIIWEIDENGDKVIYKKSPYSIAEVGNSRRYLLGNIPAIKIEIGYLNLISMTEFAFTNGHLSNKQAVADISFINKGYFDL